MRDHAERPLDAPAIGWLAFALSALTVEIRFRHAGQDPSARPCRRRDHLLPWTAKRCLAHGDRSDNSAADDEAVLECDSDAECVTADHPGSESDAGGANDQRARYTDAIRKPRGLVVVSGPAGSGRTSTLYATMRSMNCSPNRYCCSLTSRPVSFARSRSACDRCSCR